MPLEPAHRRPWHKVVREFMTEFEWIHIGLGLLGNVSFLVGSVFFLWGEPQDGGRVAVHHRRDRDADRFHRQWDRQVREEGRVTASTP